MSHSIIQNLADLSGVNGWFALIETSVYILAQSLLVFSSLNNAVEDMVKKKKLAEPQWPFNVPGAPPYGLPHHVVPVAQPKKMPPTQPPPPCKPQQSKSVITIGQRSAHPSDEERRAADLGYAQQQNLEQQIALDKKADRVQQLADEQRNRALRQLEQLEAERALRRYREQRKSVLKDAVKIVADRKIASKGKKTSSRSRSRQKADREQQRADRMTQEEKHPTPKRGWWHQRQQNRRTQALNTKPPWTVSSHEDMRTADQIMRGAAAPVTPPKAKVAKAKARVAAKAQREFPRFTTKEKAKEKAKTTANTLQPTPPPLPPPVDPPSITRTRHRGCSVLETHRFGSGKRVERTKMLRKTALLITSCDDTSPHAAKAWRKLCAHYENMLTYKDVEMEDMDSADEMKTLDLMFEEL